VIVSETMRIAGSASRSTIAVASPGGRKVDHRAGDAGDHVGCILLDHGRQEVLRGEACRRRPLGGSTPAPTIAQSWSRPEIEQVVEIDRLMRAMKIADAEMHDARRKAVAG
jgi:hypothetical protein